VRTRFVEKLFGKIDNRPCWRIILVKWTGERRNAEGDGAMVGLSFDRFPVDRGLNHVRFVSSETDFGTE
jgi:hypothetical protein